MRESKPVEIICSQCGADTLLMRKPKYDGFTKVGETLTCSSCNHEYESEDEVPFKGRKMVKVFTDADRSVDVKVFGEGEAEALCLHCLHYVINPFMQWCGRHKKEVEATDTCPQFGPRPPEEEPEDEEGKGDAEKPKLPPI